MPFLIMLRQGGELTSEFEVLGPILFFHEQVRGGIIKRVLRRLGLTKRFFLAGLKKKLAGENIGLIYSNTIVNGEILRFLSFLKCPVISHVHELENCIKAHGKTNMEQVKRYTTRYIAVSAAVKKNLVENHGIKKEDIEKIYGFLPVSEIRPQQTRESIYSELGIPAGSHAICGAGTTDWRKGPDLFIRLEEAVNRRLPERTFFLWVGGDKTSTEGGVRFLGSRKNPFDYFAACDIFAMVSREDPFPIVCLEAAALERPIVCFEKAGGIPEFVEQDCGFIVPYLDIEAMAEKIVKLLDSEGLRRSLGERARHKVIERHDINISAPRLLMLITGILSK